MLSENGVLSYYSSHDEVDQGCKGSMNVAACEIIVSQNDNMRLDVVVSHEKVIIQNQLILYVLEMISLLLGIHGYKFYFQYLLQMMVIYFIILQQL